jgi:tRNA pseudouridine55 synthase
MRPSMSNPMSADVSAGFLLVDKPTGWTSHDVVAKVRRLFAMRKVGHAGTLDPMATGLLVIGLGRATRLLRYVQDAPKEYVATACFGVATDSLDADGSVLSREPLPVGAADVSAAMGRFVGEISQVPPMVSAIKVGGRRLYELAREGTEVERQARSVTIHELELVELAPSDYPEVTFRVRCSSGTYVRTLADDLAGSFGGHAHLTELRRTRNGGMDVSAAHTVDELERRADEGLLADVVLTPAAGLPDLPAITLDEASLAAVRNGVAFPRTALPGEQPTSPSGDGPVRMLDPGGELLAVYRLDGNRALPEVVLG